MQRLRVLRGFRYLARGRMQQIDQLPVLQAIKAVLSLPAIFHQSGLLQLRKMRGNAALAGGQNLLKLGHRKFFPLQQQQQAEPVGIGQHSQRF